MEKLHTLRGTCIDSLLTLASFWLEHLAHSKITVTWTSLPLTMRPLCIFDSLNYSIFRSKEKNGTKKEEAANSKFNYEKLCCNQDSYI